MLNVPPPPPLIPSIPLLIPSSSSHPPPPPLIPLLLPSSPSSSPHPPPPLLILLLLPSSPSSSPPPPPPLIPSSSPHPPPPPLLPLLPSSPPPLLIPLLLPSSPYSTGTHHTSTWLIPEPSPTGMAFKDLRFDHKKNQVLLERERSYALLVSLSCPLGSPHAHQSYQTVCNTWSENDTSPRKRLT